MKSLIFEGIATSGKSTVIAKLQDSLPEALKVITYSEDETHVPIMEQRSELHLHFFKELLQRISDESPDVALIDRLIMTQAYRARVGIEPYAEIERMLRDYNATTVYLQVDEVAILERVMKATKHRNPEWLEYVKTKGDREQLADYYISQQGGQLELLKHSKVPYRIFNTTNHDYEAVVDSLVALIANE